MQKKFLLVTRRGFIYMDRCVHKITGITVTEKQSERLQAATVRSPVRRRVGQPRPRATAICSRAQYLDDTVFQGCRYRCLLTDMPSPRLVRMPVSWSHNKLNYEYALAFSPFSPSTFFSPSYSISRSQAYIFSFPVIILLTPKSFKYAFKAQILKLLDWCTIKTNIHIFTKLPNNITRFSNGK